MNNKTLISKSIEYFNKNKQSFLNEYAQGVSASNNKLAIFTAGMSGVGKTEFAVFLKENDNNLLHIDTDRIRDFFKPIGYDGQNSDIFQKASSKGFNELFTYSMKNNLSIILDSNFASLDLEIQNIERLLKRDYKVEIFYLYNNPNVCFEYAIRREVVTKRKVPKDVFIRSNENSYKTILEIKNIFKDKVILNFFNKKDNTIYENIDTNFLKNLIGDNFDI
jgi:hypothetical protein